jgi:uncharacterized protein YjbI with pentapeptide repeats
MATKQPRILNRLAGKRVLFSGKFDWGEEKRLKGRAEAQGATLAKALDSKLDYLVFPDATTGKTVRQKAQSLISTGATIHVTDAAGFLKLVEPTAEELLGLIRAGGKANAELFDKVRGGGAVRHVLQAKTAPRHTFAGESFEGADLSGFDFDDIAFEKCGFAGAKLDGTGFDVTHACDFANATGSNPTFKDATGSRLAGVKFKGASFEGPIAGADFSGAEIADCTFYPWYAAIGFRAPLKKASVAGVVFRGARLSKCEFDDLVLSEPDFSGADVSGCQFKGAELKKADFRGAVLKDAVLFGCKLPDGDFTKADLRGANLGEADLSRCKFAGADLTGCNLRGAKLDGADLANAWGYGGTTAAAGSVGPSLKALDALGQKVGRLSVLFRLDDKAIAEEVGVVGASKWGFHPRAPYAMSLQTWNGRNKVPFSDAMMKLANAIGHRAVRYETVKVSTTKSPKPPKEVRELALEAITEAFAQPRPVDDALAAATKAYREQENKKADAQKKKNAATVKAAEQKEQAARAKALAEITKAAGQVKDFDSFMKAIVVRTDKEKVGKATKMLKASGFQLFNDVAETHLLGVVKSQTDPDLVYACRVDHEGHYACCTQNLNVCGGLRGSICKHLLVLIIGLVKAGQLDPATIDGWVAKTHGVKPELDKEVMGDIFIRYKGAEAGDVDWRPTETVPEDYYAL